MFWFLVGFQVFLRLTNKTPHLLYGHPEAPTFATSPFLEFHQRHLVNPFIPYGGVRWLGCLDCWPHLYYGLSHQEPQSIHTSYEQPSWGASQYPHFSGYMTGMSLYISLPHLMPHPCCSDPWQTQSVARHVGLQGHSRTCATGPVLGRAIMFWIGLSINAV